MAKPSTTAKLVVTSIVISLIVLAVFILIFLNFVVPTHQITEDQIYSVMMKLFPILIGLVLIEIGIMAAKRGEPEYKDTIDKLSPNAYDSPLYSEPIDDPSSKAFAAAAASVEPKIIEKEVPVEVIREVPVEVIKKIEVPVEIIREVQVPVEVIKEVPVDRIVEKEVIKEIPVEKIIEKEVPVEVLKEVPVEVPKESEHEFLGFRDVLSKEVEDALSMGYDLSVVGVKGLTADSVEAAFGEDTLVFEENDIAYAILPFYGKADAEKATESIEEKTIASLDGRSIDIDTLLQEASL